MRKLSRILTLGCAWVLAFAWQAQDASIAGKLQGFDDYMAKVLKDWNAPGIGVGIVVGDKLVFAKGYGYRDYENKLPFTSATVCRSPQTPSYLPPWRQACWWMRAS